MFSPSRGANHDRSSRRSNVKKNTLSSRISLFTGITTSSTSLSGSGSTTLPQPASGSRRGPRASASSSQKKEQAAPLPIVRRQSTGSVAAGSSTAAVDVFAFLEHDPSRPFTADPSIEAHKTARKTRDSRPLHEEPELDVSASSLHSDSGISIRDSSPESLHYTSYPRAVLDPLREDGAIYPLRRSPLRSHQYQPTMRPRRDNESTLDAAPETANNRYFDDAPEAFYRDHPGPHGVIATRSVRLTRHDSSTDLSGYDLLAARLSDSQSHDAAHPFRPLYRKFTRLNHRILLQLQDEISQMEEDLADLDAADARVRRNSTGQMVPESRRLDWQWHGSELHARRLELLGQVYVKVEQYNQALTSFQNVIKGTTCASESDILQYRSWMKDYAPIAEQEQRFLNKPDDLLAFSLNRSCPTCGRHMFLGFDLDKGIIMVLIIVILPSAFLLFWSYPRIGPFLLISVGIALYSNRTDFNRVVAAYLQS